MVEFDDGSGSSLFVAGSFTGAGNSAAQGVARWDGTDWHALGAGIHGLVMALAVFDDGSGPALFAGGLFQQAGGVPAANIAKWNGTTWSSVGSGVNSAITSMVVFHDGSSTQLYVAGPSLAGSTPLGGVGRWNGTSWSTAGMFGSTVNVLTVHDFGGGGPLLVAGGDFLTVNSTPALRIAVGNGTIWQPLGSGFDDRVRSLASHGSDLIAGGMFNFSGSTNVSKVARWNGSSWAPLGAGLDNFCETLRSADLGSGAKLYAGGAFANSGSTVARNLAVWDGTSWSELGGGCSDLPEVLFQYPSVVGGSLFVGGSLSEFGGSPRAGLSRWTGSSWEVVAGPFHQDVSGPMFAALVADLGSGSRLYCGGNFNRVGTVSALRVAAWDGAMWSALGTGIGTASASEVDTLAVYDDGTGSKLYAGGTFFDPTLTLPSYIAAWDGSQWSWVGFGTSNSVLALKVFDEGSGPRLFAGGVFTNASGVPANRVARWDGMNWSDVGGGTDGSVKSMAVYDDGTGPALFVAGSFTTAGGQPAANLAKWNGTTWTGIVPGLDAIVNQLEVLDDGTGPALYVRGDFNTAGGLSIARLARYRNGTWSSLGAGPGIPNLSVVGGYNDGGGPAIYAVGSVALPGSSESSCPIRKWDGVQWSVVPEELRNAGGTNVSARELCVFDPGAGKGPSLFFMGSFTGVGSISSRSIAEYRGCAQPFATLCPGDGSSAACPCGNSGAAGHGCAHSGSVTGARLDASGVPRVVQDTLQLTTTDALNGPGLFFQGTDSMAGGNGVSFGDGLLCAGGSITRLWIAFATAGSAQYPTPGSDPAISVQGGCVVGTSYTYQVWFRDADPVFCSSSLFNLTNGVRVTWRP